jgi:hypothetical protein
MVPHRVQQLNFARRNMPLANQELLLFLWRVQAGNSRSLKQLAKAFLVMNIQQQQPAKQQLLASPPRHKQHKAGAARKRQQQHPQQQQQAVRRVQHDPEEDAAAVMRLYQKVRRGS